MRPGGLEPPTYRFEVCHSRTLDPPSDNGLRQPAKRTRRSARRFRRRMTPIWPALRPPGRSFPSRSGPASWRWSRRRPGTTPTGRAERSRHGACRRAPTIPRPLAPSDEGAEPQGRDPGPLPDVLRLAIRRGRELHGPDVPALSSGAARCKPSWRSGCWWGRGVGRGGGGKGRPIERTDL